MSGSATGAVVRGIMIHEALMERDADTRSRERQRLLAEVERRCGHLAPGTPAPGVLAIVRDVLSEDSR